MLSTRICVAAVVVLGGVALSIAQPNGIQSGKQTIEHISFDSALNGALKSSSLTFAGKPFHAVMEIGHPGGEHWGHIEAWWVNDKKYRVEVNSALFHQTKVVIDGHVQLKTDGDYYPRWLENFVQALMDPVAMAANFSGRDATSLFRDSQLLFTTVNRDDRTDGITDPMTVGGISFAGPDHLLLSTSMFNNSMRFADWQDFGHKKIARTCETKVDDNQKLIGHLVTLEELKHPDASKFLLDEAAATSQEISTVFISTAQAESLLQSTPAMQWPSVRAGSVDGYMIVFARADRTGQVRETAEYSSSNNNDALRKYGMEEALKYKFKPLVVDGAAVQFETPLVLHFISRIDDPIPILNVDEMKSQMLSCTPKDLPKGPPPSGKVMHCRVAVDEKGSFDGFVSSDPMRPGEKPSWGPALNSLKQCTFRPYIDKVSGKPTYFQGDIVLAAQ
jgi:hypothetical protein